MAGRDEPTYGWLQEGERAPVPADEECAERVPEPGCHPAGSVDVELGQLGHAGVTVDVTDELESALPVLVFEWPVAVDRHAVVAALLPPGDLGDFDLVASDGAEAPCAVFGPGRPGERLDVVVCA
jgi:hypothetical protein